MKRLLLLLCALLALGGCAPTLSSYHQPTVHQPATALSVAAGPAYGHRGNEVADFQLDLPFFRQAKERKKL